MEPSHDDRQQWNSDVHKTATGDGQTIELVFKARQGDRPAADALMDRCLPRLRRWAHGRLPVRARDGIDTCDLVQEVALHTLGRLDCFEPRHSGALHAYLRQALMNRIRDELRRVGRRPRSVAIPDELRSHGPTPLAHTIDAEQYRHYRQALKQLAAKDRKLVMARVEQGWSHQEIAERFGLPSAAAASMATLRAARRLAEKIARPPHHQAGGSPAAVKFCSDGSK